MITRKFPHIIKEFEQAYLPASAEHSGIEIEIMESKKGLPVARVRASAHKGGRQLFLNSFYDPDLEAERWLANLELKSQDCLIICGSGFLYHLKVLLKSRRARETFRRIIIYEPSLEILSACLQEVDWEPLCGEGNFLLVVGENHGLNSEMVFSFMGYTYFGAFLPNFQIEVLPAYARLFGDEINGFQNKIKEFIQLIRQNLIAFDYYAEKWLANCFKNLRSMMNSPGIGGFFNRFSGVPAIVVSAGPSLEKNIRLLNAMKEKVLIICAGSSIRAMLHHGVRPHFLVAVDGDEINRLVYNDLDLHDISLVYSARFFHAIVTEYRGPKILMRTDNEFFTELLGGDQATEIGILHSGYSVSHISLDLAVRLGCNPIILIGQDLAFSDNKCYAKGQVPSFQTDMDSQLLMGEDIYGRDVLTCKDFDIFRRVFEKIINDYGPEIKVINATEGGIPIAGVPNYKLTDVLAEYCGEDLKISERIRGLYEQGYQKINQRRGQLEPLRIELKKTVDQAIADIWVLLERLQELRRFVYTQAIHPKRLALLLNQITTAYDSALNAPQFNILLKELREGKLSVIKLQVSSGEPARLGEAGEDYDFILQNCLIFFNETKKYLEFIRNCIEELQAAKAGDWSADMPLNQEGVDVNSGGNFFRLFRSFQASNDLVMANQCLEQCRRLKFKPDYCLRRLIKNHYLSRDYIRASNLIVQYQTHTQTREVSGWRFLNLLKLKCLWRLGLSCDAQREYSRLLQEQQIRAPLNKGIQHPLMRELVTEAPRSTFQEMYRKNREFFKRTSAGADFGEYNPIRYKVFPFISGSFIYDSRTGWIFPGIPDSPTCDLELTPEDVLCIHNPNNPVIFHRLSSFLSGTAQKIAQIPVFIIEECLENWHLFMQLFDFKSLSDWWSIYICIAPLDEALYNLFLEENLPLPNNYYGTEPERFGRVLASVIVSTTGYNPRL